MTGCITLRKDVYYVRLSYYDKNRKRKDKFISTGLSGRGAKQKATAMIESLIEKYSYLEKSDHPSKMADYLAMWKNLRKSEVAETTYDGYHTYIDRHLIPYFREQNLDIQDITAGHIFDYVNYLSSDGGRKDNKIGGQSVTSIRKIISILRQVFDYAVLYGDIKINPALHVPLPKRSNKKDERQVFLTAEEAQKMLNAFQNEEIGPIVFVTLYYGLRKSEALGLRWQAVDFDNNTITVNHTVVSNGHIVRKDSTKTYSSQRTYQLLPDVKALLLKLKDQQADYKRRLGSGYHKNLENDALYFASPTSYNDPYEGVLANDMVDLFEAFFTAQMMHASPKYDAILPKIKPMFRYLKNIINVNNSSDINEAKIHTQTVLNDFFKNATYNDVQLVAMELLYSDLYIENFKSISQVYLPIDAYSIIVKNALNENKRLSSKEKGTYHLILVNSYMEKYSIVNRYRQSAKVIIPIALVDGIFNSPFRRNTYEETLKEYNDAAIELFANIRAMPGEFFLTTCLSETPCSILVWSHYAINHTGFCIEYDFNLLPPEDSYIFNHLAKVNYTDQLPKLSTESLVQVMRKKIDPSFQKDSLITAATIETCVEAILTKNIVWDYEQEWRLVFSKQQPKPPQTIPGASKIILGNDISESNKALLLSLAQKKKLPVFQAFLMPDKYAIDFYQIQ